MTTYRAHGHRFALDVAEETLRSYLCELFLPLAADDDTSVDHVGTYRITLEQAGWALTFDGEQVTASPNLGVAVGMLQWHINTEVIATAGARTLLHAAAAANADGRAVLLPAAMESGKSTLCAALIQDGWSYLSDEAVGVEGTTATPYHKPLSLDPGSWPLFPDLKPEVPEGLAGVGARQWQIPVHRLREDAIVGASPLAAVVLPTYRRGEATALEPIHPADAISLVAGCTFGFADDAARHFEVLADLLEQVPCFTLAHDDLDEAVAAIRSAVAG